jgi:hypothetical protein
MKQILLTLIIVVFISQLKAQVAVSYMPFQSVLSMSSDRENNIWLDVRAETNSFIANTNLETNLAYNFKKKDKANFYGGLGVNYNPFNGYQNTGIINGYNIKIGSQIKAFEKLPKAFIQFEISPYVNRYFDSARIRTYLGLGYNF